MFESFLEIGSDVEHVHIQIWRVVTGLMVLTNNSPYYGSIKTTTYKSRCRLYLSHAWLSVCKIKSMTFFYHDQFKSLKSVLDPVSYIKTVKTTFLEQYWLWRTRCNHKHFWNLKSKLSFVSLAKKKCFG